MAGLAWTEGAEEEEEEEAEEGIVEGWRGEDEVYEGSVQASDCFRTDNGSGRVVFSFH